MVVHPSINPCPANCKLQAGAPTELVTHSAMPKLVFLVWAALLLPLALGRSLMYCPKVRLVNAWYIVSWLILMAGKRTGRLYHGGKGPQSEDNADLSSTWMADAPPLMN